MAERRAGAWLGGSAEAPDLLFLGAPTGALSLSPSQAQVTPAAFRQALSRFPTWDAVHAVDLENLAVKDLGDVDMGGDPLDARARLEGRARDALGTGATLALCGGDNSITYAGVRGLAAALDLPLSGGQVGLITLDAHHDLRETDPRPSNGSPVFELLHDGLPGTCVKQVGISAFANQRSLTERALRAGVGVYPVHEVRQRGVETVIDDALAKLDGCAAIYVDIDLDVLDRAFAPACPASLPGGMAPADLAAAAFRLGLHARVRVVDMVEVDSAADVAEITTRTAAMVFLSFAAGLASRLS